MDSEVTNLSQVKSFDSSDYATAAQGTKADAALPKAGGTMTGNTLHGDNVKQRFGAANNLEIYADNINSYIAETGGSGNLVISGQTVRLSKSDGEIMLEATNDGKVDIRHDGSTKLETASGGIDVTGNIVVSGTVDGRDLATDGTKLDGVEASADVTDATNVTAAGALMDSEVTNLAQVKSFASSDYATAAQGTLATNALPKAGGTITGDLVVNDDFTVDTDTFLVNSGTDNVEINGYLTVNPAPGASGVDINTCLLYTSDAADDS